MILYLFNGLLLTMNASSWKKTADIIAKVTPADPQVQAAAMAESQNLQSLPLSTLSVDDSGPPQVTYEGQRLPNHLRYLQKHTVRYYQV